MACVSGDSASKNSRAAAGFEYGGIGTRCGAAPGIEGVGGFNAPGKRMIGENHSMVETLKLSVRGMTCANCVRGVEKKLGSVPGVTKAKVDLTAASATVEYDTELVKPEAIANAVRELGYEAA